VLVDYAVGSTGTSRLILFVPAAASIDTVASNLAQEITPMPKIDTTAPERDTVSTPEGDSEFAPDAPLTPDEVEQAVDNMQIPNGNAPSPYNTDEPGEVKEAVDKLSLGQILT